MTQNLAKFKSLQKLDLSFNLIRALPNGQVMGQLTSLRILYLHDNLITNWTDLNSVCQVPGLVHLTLIRNPVAQIAGYRHQIVNAMKNLKALDEFIVTDEERLDYSAPNALRFRALSSQYMKVFLPKFVENQSADQHIFNLDVELYRIKRLYERNSPSIRIQSLYRGYYYRSKAIFSYSQKKKAAIKIQKVVRGWLYRLRIKKELRKILKSKDMDYLLMSQKEYVKFQALQTIERAVFRFLKKKRRNRLHYNSASLIQKVWRGKCTKHTSFIKALQMDQGDFRLYFLKEQKMEFLTIIEEVYAMLQKKSNLQEDLLQLKSRVSNDSEFLMIRYPNPLNFKKHEYPLLQLSSPSYQCRVKVNEGMSKLIKGGQPITNLYTRFSSMTHEKQILTKIKKRLCNFSTSDTSLVYQARQSKLHSLRMRKLYDNYQELMVFTSPSQEFTKLVCQRICRNNLLSMNENLLVFFPLLLKRVSAAIKIQQSFRSYQIRKEQHEIIQQKKKILIYPPIEACFAKALIQHRAVNCISQWWKYLKLKHRLEALTHIKAFLQTIDSPTLYMEENIYFRLGDILGQGKKNQAFIDQQVNFDFYHPNALKGLDRVKSQGGLIKQESQMSEGIDDQSYHIAVQNYNDLTDRFKHQPFPLWLMHAAQLPSHSPFPNLTQTTPYVNEALGLIHRASFDSMSQVKDYNEIVSPYEKQMHLSYGLNFIEVQCGTVSEAKKRAMVLAFMSYDMKQKSFIRMYSKTSLSDGVFLKNLYQLWLKLELPQGEAKMQSLVGKGIITAADIQILRDRQRQQPHQGVALSTRDRHSIEGHHLMLFDAIEKKFDVPSSFTMKQRSEAHKKKEYLYLEKLESEETLKLDINMHKIMLEDRQDSLHGINSEASTPFVQQKILTQKMSHYHISSKEPVSVLQNLSMKDMTKAAVQQSKQYNIGDIVPMPSSTKSGTAQPGSRTVKGKPGLKIKEQGNFFSLRKSSNAASTKLNSQEATSMLRTNVNVSQNSTFVSRAVSMDKSMIGEQENLRLLQQQRQEHQDQLDHQRLAKHYSQQARKEEVAKLREINQVMKQFVKLEQEAQIQMYRRFNQQEKELLSELHIKEQDRYEKEQQARRQMVAAHLQKKKRKSSDREWVNGFAQIRNMISKQSQIGQVMRMKNAEQRERQEKVREIRQEEKQAIKNKSNQASNSKLKPIISTVFDAESVIEKKLPNHIRIPMTAVHSPRQHSLFDKFNSQKQLSNKPPVSLNNSQLDSEFVHLKAKNFDFGLKEKNRYSQLQKLTFIEESYPLQVSSSFAMNKSQFL